MLIKRWNAPNFEEVGFSRNNPRVETSRVWTETEWCLKALDLAVSRLEYLLSLKRELKMEKERRQLEEERMKRELQQKKQIEEDKMKRELETEKERRQLEEQRMNRELEQKNK